MKKEDSENALLEQAKKGDEQAIATIYNEYKHMIFNNALKVLKNYADAEDAVSQTFERFLTYKHTIKTGPLGSWLNTTARNVCMDIFKDKSRNFGNIEDIESTKLEKTISETNPYKDPAEIYHQQKDKEELVQILEKLPKDYMKVVELHYTDGYTCQEIANKLGRTKNAVKLLLFKARRRAKEIIEKTPSLSEKFGCKKETK